LLSAGVPGWHSETVCLSEGPTKRREEEMYCDMQPYMYIM